MKIAHAPKCILIISEECYQMNRSASLVLLEMTMGKYYSPFDYFLTFKHFDEVILKDLCDFDLVLLYSLFRAEEEFVNALIKTAIKNKKPLIICSSLSYLLKKVKNENENSEYLFFEMKPIENNKLIDLLNITLYKKPIKNIKYANTGIIEIDRLDYKIIRYISKNSNLLFKLNPRLFEKLVAGFLNSMGWKIELTPFTKDGGIDVIAIKKIDDISHKMLVQVKRNNEKRKVGVNTIREFMHIIDETKANSGMIITTSDFTKGAYHYQNKYSYLLSLKSHKDVVDYMRKIDFFSDKNWLRFDLFETKPSPNAVRVSLTTKQ